MRFARCRQRVRLEEAASRPTVTAKAIRQIEAESAAQAANPSRSRKLRAFPGRPIARLPVGVLKVFRFKLLNGIDKKRPAIAGSFCLE